MATDVEVGNKILYDMTVYTEWKQESETIYRAWKEEKNVTLPRWLASMTQRTAWTVLRTVGISPGSNSPCLLPVGLQKLVNSHLHWHFDVTEDAKFVAVLQDQELEIRSFFDGYSSPVGKASLSKKDPYPQWRRVAWSPSGDMVACTDSLGQVLLFDTFCTPISTLPCGWTPQANTPVDLSRAICALIFKPCQDHKKWHYELIVINYQGTLKKYLISRDGEFQLLHTFSFSRHYPQGIGAVLYHSKYELLIVGGCGDTDDDPDTPDAHKYGLTAWRLLSGAPHYKRVTDYEQDLYEAQRKRNLMRKLRTMTKLNWWYGKEQDGISGLALSPNGQILASIHQSGRYTLWDIPSLRLRKTWPLEEQPGYDDVNQAIAENPKKRKMMKEHLTAFWLADTNWWNDQSVIMTRGSGAVTVAAENNLDNLLGMSPEWFEPAPLVSQSHDGGFLSLECECKYQSLKRHLSDSSDGSGSEEEYEDSEDELDLDVIQKSTRMVKYGLYYVTDMERFQPPRKKPKLVTRTYRLLCLKSTTPDELYTKRISNEEYGEALELAKAYGLDCDRVYKRQWEKTPVSIASIQDYLSKISKRSWVLHECLERIPVNIDAMRELLKYGLRGTDVEALITIGKGEDQGRFIFCDRGDVYEESIDTFDPNAHEKFKAKEKQRELELIKQVDFSKLTLDQRELCRARIKLLQYLDRLSTYEEILGGENAAEEHYDSKFFEEFRSKNIVEVAVDYTRCDWRALDTLFCYHGTDLLPHRLAILANFPETFCPFEYRDLLPEAGCKKGDPEVKKWKEYYWRDPDWVEQGDIRKATDPIQLDFGAFLYEDFPEYSKFQGTDLTRDDLTDWYVHRAKEIEELSRQVDHALELINLGIERHVNNLENLQDDLTTMETLVYECLIDDILTFEDLIAMPDIDRLRLMMSRTSEEMYVKNVRRWLVPYLERCEKRKSQSFYPLLREYMITMARSDLTLCLKIFETSKANLSQPVLSDEMELIPLALDCIYTCKESDQLANAFGILECLPQRGFGIVSKSLAKLHTQIDELECHLSAAEILEKHQIAQTISYIRDTQNNIEGAKQLLVKLTRVAGRKEPAPAEEDWRELLQDMLSLQVKVFRCVSAADCYQIFVESLLTSGRHVDIQLAGKMIESSMKEAEEPDYLHLENEHYGKFEKILVMFQDDYKYCILSNIYNLKDRAFISGNNFATNDLFQIKVSYKKAVDLVMCAAREYFDASANLSDTNMEMAKACLSLIKDQPSKIVLELDLIESLALLDGFGVKILPIQVRMSSNKLELVRKAIEEKPYTYKNSQRLLKLGKLLHLDAHSVKEIDGQVLKMCAQYALKAKDLSTAYENCYNLMHMGYAPVWEECKQLAQDEEFQDIKAKCDLLSFAVTHCTPDMIEPILRAKCLLETQISYEKVHKQMSPGRDSQSPSSQLSVTGALQQTKHILSSTNQATKAVLSHVKDKTWWKKTLKSIHPGQRVIDDVENDDGNENFTKTGVHPFYETLVENAYDNKSEADYKSISIPKVDKHGTPLSELILRTSKLEEVLTEGESFHPATEVLLQLAQDTIKEDTALGLAYLLALPKAEEADKCLENCPKTGVSLQLMTYYYALQIYRHLSCKNEGGSQIDHVYLHEPADVTAKVLKLVGKGTVNECSDLGERLQNYNEKLLDYIQAQVLIELGRGVDVGRFADDNEYKKETILGLAMSTEQAVYDIAVNLAKRYKVPLWELYMAHLEYLFESGLSVEDIEKRVSHLTDLLPTLKSKPEEFSSRMKTFVYPTLAGTDHDKLLYYYGLLSGCRVQGEADPNAHAKILKKVVTLAKDLDYKKLIDPKQNTVEVVQPVLTSENVNQVAKLVGKVPNEQGDNLQPSIVYCGWALRQFWEGVALPKKNNPESDSDWIHRYESCHEYVNKLTAEDFMKFIDVVLFSEQSPEKLSPNCRQEILKRASKFSKQQSGKSKTENNGWKETVSNLQQYNSYLELLCTDLMVDLWHSDDPVKKQYAKVFALSKAQPEQVSKVFIQMVADGQSPDFIQDILNIVPDEGDVKTVYKDALNLVTKAFSDSSIVKSVLKRRPPMEVLKTVITEVSRHTEQGGEIIDYEDIINVLRPFCKDSSMEIGKRQRVLELLDNSFDLQEEDFRLLLLYKSIEVTRSHWPDLQLTEDNIKDNFGREDLFMRLLQESIELPQLMALGKLSQIWPPLESFAQQSRSPEKHPYTLIVKKMMSCGTPDQCSSHIIAFMKSIQTKHGFPEQCLAFVSSLLFMGDYAMASVKIVLLYNYERLYVGAVEKLQMSSEPEDDEELVVLILKRNQFPNIVPTCYYKKVTDYILSQNQSAESSEFVPDYLQVENLAQQLQEAGYESEANGLISRYKGASGGLRPLGAAFGALSRWLTK